eukprot:5143706-Prymnesium_polylepis.2
MAGLLLCSASGSDVLCAAWYFECRPDTARSECGRTVIQRTAHQRVVRTVDVRESRRISGVCLLSYRSRSGRVSAA